MLGLTLFVGLSLGDAWQILDRDKERRNARQADGTSEATKLEKL
jgi:hypothetical protein